MKNNISDCAVWRFRGTKVLYAIILLLCVCINQAEALNKWTILSWNNLGMHCMDDDYSVFSILPPYNTVHAQLVFGANGNTQLQSSGFGYSVTYHAVADPAGSINTTSIDKSNFWTYAPQLLGTNLADDAGVPIPGYGQSFMPGAANTPQEMGFDTSYNWFQAFGIPITPYDDQLKKNFYPLMRITVNHNILNKVVDTTDIVLPVSDEMDCRVCHASGSGSSARPDQGWVWEPVPTRDYRLNILRLHDQDRFQEIPDAYKIDLAAAGFTTNGLYASVTVEGKPVLCVSCHNSEILQGSGLAGILPLTQAIHGRHASVIDPWNGLTLDAVDNSSSCYRCHPGSETRCLRGAMGSSVGADGEPAMQCQSCHGSMSAVASPDRDGWLDEPNCQACHTGDALNNSGQIRYTSVFDANGDMRVPPSSRFATNPNTPASGYSLFRFSVGHGGLQCSACHGAAHAIYPSAHTNDNLTAIQFQGHEGTFSECTQCHSGSPANTLGGPHGLHPIGDVWLEGHQIPGLNAANCITCHGIDQRGTVLSRAQADRSFTIYGSVNRTFWRGYQIGCYTCHQGYNNIIMNPNQIPVAQNVNTNTAINIPVSFTLPANDGDDDPLTYRIVKQPYNGRIGLSGSTATYYPDNTFAGVDSFTFAASDNMSDSNLGHGVITVGGGPCVYTLTPSNQSFSELGQAGTIQVATGAACGWMAASECVWLSILSPGGSPVTGPGNVAYRLTRNLSSSPRSGTLRIAGLTFTVNQAAAPPDLNGDDLPDSWQSLYFTGPYDPEAAPGEDPDLDGITNMDEYLSGTIPDSDSSFLRITSFNVEAVNHIFQLAFPSVVQRYYQVQRTPDLQNPDWQGFTNAVIGTGIELPQSGVLVPESQRMFYRVRLVE